MKTEQRRGGFEGEAYGGCNGADGELGEGPAWAERRRRSRAAEGEDNGDGGVLGPPASYSSVERTRGPRRFFWTAQGRYATAVGAMVVNGVDGSAWLREGERAEEGRAFERE